MLTRRWTKNLIATVVAYRLTLAVAVATGCAGLALVIAGTRYGYTQPGPSRGCGPCDPWVVPDGTWNVNGAAGGITIGGSGLRDVSLNLSALASGSQFVAQDATRGPYLGYPSTDGVTGGVLGANQPDAEANTAVGIGSQIARTAGFIAQYGDTCGQRGNCTYKAGVRWNGQLRVPSVTGYTNQAGSVTFGAAEPTLTLNANSSATDQILFQNQGTTRAFVDSKGLTIGSGAQVGAITKIGFGSVGADIVNMLANECQRTAGITITGAAVSDVCIAGSNDTTQSYVTRTCEITAANTVDIQICCHNGAAGQCDPPNQTYYAVVLMKG